MIGEFIDSWALFGETYIAALLIALSTSMLGVLVVTRNQVFAAASISQASLLGIALSLYFGWSNTIIPVMVLSIAASLLMGRGIITKRGDNEEMTGWVFLVAASSSVLFLAHHPNGMRELQSALASSMIGVSMAEVWMLAIVTAIVVVSIGYYRRPIALFILDPVMAVAVGMSLASWSFFSSVAVGVLAGLSIKATGMLFTFGCFVLPAMAARNFCKELGKMFWVAPVFCLLSVFVALVFSNSRDLPPGQAGVVTMAVGLVVSWVWKRVRDSIETPIIAENPSIGASEEEVVHL